jgi:hypothetical protein
MRHGNIDRLARISACFLAAALLIGSSGCRMCCAPYDWDFGYTGGAWVRDNPSSGRVGSAFDPAGYKAMEVDPADREPTPAGDGQPPAIENLDPVDPPENAEPMPAPGPAPGMISAPRLRPVRNYLPQN